MLATVCSLPALVVAYGILVLVGAALRGAGLAPVHGALPPTTSALVNLLGDALVYGAVVGVVLWITVGRRHLPLSLLGLRRASPAVLVLMPLVAVALQLAGSLITATLGPAFHAGPNPQVCQIQRGFGGSALIGVLAIAVIAPVSEELVFRGFLYGTLRQRMRWWVAAALSALIFAGFHAASVGGYVLLLLPALFLAGLVLAAVYEWTRSLWPGVVVHASYNLLAVLLILLVTPGAHCG